MTTQKLRHHLMQDFSQHRLAERGKTCTPEDMDVFLQTFATFLEELALPLRSDIYEVVVKELGLAGTAQEYWDKGYNEGIDQCHQFIQTAAKELREGGR